MRQFILVLLFIGPYCQISAQDSTGIDLSDTTKYEEFTFIAPENFVYRRDSETSKPISFKMIRPSNPLKLWHTNSKFELIYDNSQKILIRTRLFGKDSLIVRQEEVGSFEAERFLNRYFLSWDDSKDEDWITLQDRRHFLVEKNGNYILLFNILPQNFERFVAAAQSFREF